MIKFTLVKHIFRNFQTKELGCWAYKEMKMPFAPYPGLIIYQGHGGVYKVHQVEWNDWDKKTYCNVYPFTQDYETEKQMAQEEGWQLRELPAGNFADWWKDEYDS